MARVTINSSIKELLENDADIRKTIWKLASSSFNNAIKNNDICSLLPAEIVAAAAKDYWLLGEAFITKIKNDFILLNPNIVRVRVVKGKEDEPSKRICLYTDVEIKCMNVSNLASTYDLRGTSVIMQDGTVKEVIGDLFPTKLLSEVIKWKEI